MTLPIIGNRKHNVTPTLEGHIRDSKLQRFEFMYFCRFSISIAVHFQRQFGVIVNVEDISDQECFPIVGLHKLADKNESCEVPMAFLTETCDTSSNVARILTKQTGIKVTIS